MTSRLFCAMVNSMSQRRFYTPEEVARELALGAKRTPQRIGDFCVGDGSLIRAAVALWPGAQFFINDVDGNAVGLASSCVENVSSLNEDFLSDNFSGSFAPYADVLLDLILMNPPFSNVDQRRWSPTGRFSSIRCSQALAFVLSAIDYLADGGELLAILPTSALTSDRDREALDLLRSRYSFDIIRRPAYNLFPSVSASTFLVRIARCGNVVLPFVQRTEVSECVEVEVVRGNVSVPRSQRLIATNECGWIHTTSIFEGKLGVRYAFPTTPFRCVFAPGASVILPRVGKFAAGNIAVLNREERVALSDCLFAIPCGFDELALALYSGIIADFSNLVSLYSGTGAPYLTKSRLQSYLRLQFPEISKSILDCSIGSDKIELAAE